MSIFEGSPVNKEHKDERKERIDLLKLCESGCIKDGDVVYYSARRVTGRTKFTPYIGKNPITGSESKGIVRV